MEECGHSLLRKRRETFLDCPSPHTPSRLVEGLPAQVEESPVWEQEIPRGFRCGVDPGYEKRQDSMTDNETNRRSHPPLCARCHRRTVSLARGRLSSIVIASVAIVFTEMARASDISE